LISRCRLLLQVECISERHTFSEFEKILGKGPPSTEIRVETYARKRYHHGRSIGSDRRSSTTKQ
jgi:hypothetical protein